MCDLFRLVPKCLEPSRHRASGKMRTCGHADRWTAKMRNKFADKICGTTGKMRICRLFFAGLGRSFNGHKVALIWFVQLSSWIVKFLVFRRSFIDVCTYYKLKGYFTHFKQISKLSNIDRLIFIYIDFISHQNAASYTLHTTQHQNKNS